MPPDDPRPPRPGPGHRRPTISDVATLVGLSKATVSRALNDRDRISAETRARVLATLQEIGYTRSHAARSLSTGQTGLIGLVIGGNRNPVALSAMQGAMAAAGSADFGVVVYISATDDDHAGIYSEVLGSRGVDGVVHLFPRASDTAAIEALQRGGVPVVAVEPQVPMSGVTTVWSDTFAAGRLGAEHLIGLGHRRIAICADQVPWGKQRGYLEGFRAACAGSGIDVDPSLVAELGWTHEAGFEATSRWLALADPPSAACFCCDTAALGAMAAARERGIALPDKLALVGYDDTDVAQWVSPALTTFRDSRLSLVRHAVDRLVELMAGGTPGGEYVVPAELVVRASSARPVRPRRLA